MLPSSAETAKPPISLPIPGEAREDNSCQLAEPTRLDKKKKVLKYSQGLYFSGKRAGDLLLAGPTEEACATMQGKGKKNPRNKAFGSSLAGCRHQQRVSGGLHQLVTPPVLPAYLQCCQLSFRKRKQASQSARGHDPNRVSNRFCASRGSDGLVPSRH